MSDTMNNITSKIEAMEMLKSDVKALMQQKKAMEDALERMQSDIISSMSDLADSAGIGLNDIKITVGNKQYAVGLKRYYSIKVEDRDVGYPALRACGLGYLITERIDNNSLTKALREAAEENGGELPESMRSLPLTLFEDTVLTGRATGRKSS